MLIAELLDPEHNLGIRLKWPNDLYLGQKKLAGILIETHNLDGLVISVGLNLSQTQNPRFGFLEQVQPDANLHRIRMVEAMSNHLATLHPKDTDILDEKFIQHWEKRDLLTQKSVILHTASGEISGRYKGINHLGHICILDRLGALRSYPSASVDWW